MRNLYSIYDRKSSSYGPLFEARHDAVAIREFGSAVEDQRSNLAKYPEDFELHYLGTFDDDSHTEGGHAKIDGPLFPDEVRCVITADAWLASRHKPSQLELMKEAANG